jgi:exodeoxyribonuclease V alpha subunit
VKQILIHLLPPHETAFALTVHKSQGSEFEEIFLILPDEDSPLLTRELLYTAITRAKQRVSIWARKDILVKAVKRQVQRTSGLRDKLWQC